MNQIVNYISRELGLDIEITPVDNNYVKGLPTFLLSVYKFFICQFYNQSVILAHLLSDNYAPSNYLKHKEIIEQKVKKPVIFVFDKIKSYNKGRFCSLGLNFIVPESIIYLPELLIIAKKANMNRLLPNKQLSPTAQVVLLNYLYGTENDYTYKQLQNALTMPYPTIVRAIEQLSVSNLCEIIGTRLKYIHFDENKTTLLKRALSLLKTPVQRVVYSSTMPHTGYSTGISALSEFTMINSDEFKHVAVSYETFKMMESVDYEDRFNPVHIEVWNYNPGLFAQNGFVDRISLYLSMKNDPDERIQFALNNIIDTLW